MTVEESSLGFRLPRTEPRFLWTWSSYLWCFVAVEALLLLWSAAMVPVDRLAPHAEGIGQLYGVNPGTTGLVDFLPPLNLAVVVLIWLGSRFVRASPRRRFVHRWTCVAAAVCLAALSMATIVSAPPPRPLAQAIVVTEPGEEASECELREPTSVEWLRRLCAD